MHGVMVMGAAFIWKHRIEYITSESPNFVHVMIEATFTGVFIRCFLSPFVTLPESGKAAKYITSWTDYQVKKKYRASILFGHDHAVS
jgi:hypothetical protein